MEMVAYLLRINASRRWRSVALLALVVGLAGSTVIALAAGAERTSTSVDRLAAVSNSTNITVFSLGVTPRATEIEKLPGVAGAIAFPFVSLPLDNVSARYEALVVDNPQYGRTLEKGPVVRGRMFDPQAVDELVVDEKFASDTGLDVGDVVSVRLPTQAELLAVPQEARFPVAIRTGPALTLRIVGVQRTPLMALDDESGGGNIVATPALLKDYNDELTGGGIAPGLAMVWLKPGTDPLDFDAEIVARGFVGSTTSGDGIAAADPAARLQGAALYVTAIVLGLASLLLVALIISRLTRGIIRGSRAMATVGLDRRTRQAEAVTWNAVAGLAGAVIALVGSYALSGSFPVGLARWVEPSPGASMSPWVVLGALFTLVVVLISAVASSWRALKIESSEPASAHARGLWGFSLPLTTALASRGTFAPNPTERPSVSLVWVATLLATFGIAASVVVASGIDSVTQNDRVSGRTADLVLFAVDDVAAAADQAAQTRADDDVDGVWELRATAAILEGSSVNVIGATRAEADPPVVLVEGRAPVGAGEIVLAPRTLERSGVRIGDTAELTVGDESRSVRVVGSALVDTTGGTAFDEGAYLDAEGYAAAFGDSADFRYALVAVKDGVDVDTWQSEFTRKTSIEFQILDRPVSATNVARIGGTPLLLAGLLGLLAAIAAGVALLSHARSLRPQHAVLRSLGLRQRQSWWVLPQHAVVVGLASILIAAPLGVLAGRWVWRGLAEAQNLLYVAPTLGLRAGVLAAGIVFVLVLLSVAPSTVLARLDVPRTLRRE